MIFDDLDLNPELLESIDYMGFRETTPIQEKAIPVILSGRHRKNSCLSAANIEPYFVKTTQSYPHSCPCPYT
jgi:hypothetical protein